ncbi:MAG TPA: hypothetical protein VK533_05770 [Sphingomonas sp.]|uniref:hypothetical protein n=1 Tax=Sphingomonas sp. TaxID=28214 RepID=UPI002C79A16F|nr:hypothetical protein [Sphingomonas sp.]HMI19034.1 hypothetical protein [Sphingomonas sp.]
MAAENSDGGSFTIGGVFGRAFGVMGHNPLVAFGVSFMLAALPGALLSYLLINLRLDLQQSGVFQGVVVSAVIGSVVYLVLRSLVQGCLARATVADSEGRQASLGECLATAFSRLLPLIGTTLLFVLAVLAGSVLLIVPGIMVGVAFAVVIPVTVEERVGVIAAFGRAADLTRGARWKVFGLLLVMAIVLWVLAAIAGLFQLLIVGVPQVGTMPMSYIVFNAVITTISATFAATITTGLYVELREWKDGPLDAKLGEIFE